MATLRIKWKSTYTFSLLHIAVGIPFLIAGWAKASHPNLFIDHLVYRHSWFPESAAPILAPILAWTELITGCMLVSLSWTKLARRIAGSLLVLFVLYLSLSLAWGTQLPCSCYGPLIPMNTTGAFLVDILLLAVLVYLERNPLNVQSKLRFLICASLVAALVLLGRATPRFDHLLVQIKPGMEIPILPSLDPRAVNSDLPRLVFITQSPLPQSSLQSLAQQFPNRELVILYSSELPAHPQDTSIGVHLSMKKDLVSLFAKSFPTCFALDGKKVSRVWYGLLPTPPIP